MVFRQGLLADAPEVSHDIVAAISSSEAVIAAEGLNQAYIEKCMPSRLSRLWVAVEDVFGGKPKPLLNEEEVKQLIAQARGIESLRNDSGRLQRLKDALSNPDRLPLISRNERMSDAIAPIMGISVKEAYSKVRLASELRGKHGHQLGANWKDIEASEEFLQEALRSYFTRQKMP